MKILHNKKNLKTITLFIYKHRCNLYENMYKNIFLFLNKISFIAFSFLKNKTF